VATLGTISPLLLYQFSDPALAAGRALWEWSAAGGPTIQASYRLDGLATVGIAAGFAYVAAGLLANARSAASPRFLPSLALAAGLYPFVPWRYQPAQALAAAERDPLRGLLAMPAGVAASVVLLRVLGVTSIDLSNLGLPLVTLGPRLALLALVLVAFAFRA